MDEKKKIPTFTKILMAIGFVIGGIGGAATAMDIPDNIAKITQKKVESTSVPEEIPEKTEE